MMQLKTELTPAKIIKLAREDVFVSRYLEFWERGEMTWEQALIGLIETLVVMKKDLLDQLLEVKSRSNIYVVNNVPNKMQEAEEQSFNHNTFHINSQLNIDKISSNE